MSVSGAEYTRRIKQAMPDIPMPPAEPVMQTVRT